MAGRPRLVQQQPERPALVPSSCTSPPTRLPCSWADAYHRMLGKPYYPKLLVGVPFTPVPGPHLLVKPGAHAGAVRRALADTLKQVGGRAAVCTGRVAFAGFEPPLCALPAPGSPLVWHITGAGKGSLAQELAPP